MIDILKPIQYIQSTVTQFTPVMQVHDYDAVACAQVH